jgi:uncharacterized protein (DUF849 family)
MKPTILTCAVTGSFPTRAQNPALPVTPQEIADACIGAAKAGAAICHIHVREPDSGRPSMKLEYYREVVERIRGSDTDLIINLTAGPGGRFIPSDDEPAKAAPGTLLTTPEIRTAHIVELRPEICTLDLNTQWFGGGAVINSPRSIKAMAERMYAREAGARDLQHRRHHAGARSRCRCFEAHRCCPCMLSSRNGSAHVRVFPISWWDKFVALGSYSRHRETGRRIAK